MVEIANIKDPESLRDWLLETRQPREAFVWLAHRGAMRILPLFWEWAGRQHHSPMLLLRANLIINIAALARPQLLSVGGYAERARAAAGAASASTSAEAAYAVEAASATDYAYDAKVAIYIYAYADAVYTIPPVWRNVRADCELLASAAHRDSHRPLWDETPDDVAEHWAEVKETYTEDHWRFWLDWYARALAGEPQPWDLIQEIALQPDEFWEGSDEEINRRILALAEEYAVDASYNAEVVDVAKPGRLTVTAVSGLRSQFLEYAVDRIRDAVDDMRPRLETSNQFAALSEDLDRLDDYLDRYNAVPLRLHQVCVRTVRRIDRRIADGVLPEENGDLEDFRRELEDTAIELTADPEVKESVKRQLAAHFPEMEETQKVQYRAASEKVAEICEDQLAEEIVADIAIANDPTVSEDDRNEARFRWGSRMLRIYRIVSDPVQLAGATVALAPVLAPLISQIIAWFL